MMQLSYAGSGVMSAFYPAESELSKRIRRLIRAVRKQLEALCTTKEPSITRSYVQRKAKLLSLASSEMDECGKRLMKP